MSVTLRMLSSWRQPRVTMQGILSVGKREDRALVTLMSAALIMFVGQWPDLARKAYFDPSIPLEGRLLAAMMSMMFMLPLMAYAIAAIVHILMKLFGGKGTFYSARMALFWSMLCVSPFMLLQGLLLGFLGNNTGVNVMGGVIFAGFLYQWINAVIVAERPDAAMAAE